jgi:very-long-chain (3R)-3-hydroxyacyl-CoA dehydratase
MNPKDGYLVLYNLSCCIGWAGVWLLAVLSLIEDVPSVGIVKALADVYDESNLPELLALVQSAALLEIVHAGIGFVRSPVTVTAMQVMSRIVALFAIYFSPDAQSTLLCVIFVKREEQVRHFFRLRKIFLTNLFFPNYFF